MTRRSLTHAALALACAVAVLLAAAAAPARAEEPKFSGCRKPHSLLCTMLDEDHESPNGVVDKVQGLTGDSEGRELEEAVAIGHLESSKSCVRFYRRLQCNNMYPRCTAAAEPGEVAKSRGVCLSSCQAYVKKCDPTFRCEGFSNGDCITVTSAAWAAAAPSVALAAAAAAVGLAAAMLV